MSRRALVVDTVTPIDHYGQLDSKKTKLTKITNFSQRAEHTSDPLHRLTVFGSCDQVTVYKLPTRPKSNSSYITGYRNPEEPRVTQGYINAYPRYDLTVRI